MPRPYKRVDWPRVYNMLLTITHSDSYCGVLTNSGAKLFCSCIISVSQRFSQAIEFAQNVQDLRN